MASLKEIAHLDKKMDEEKEKQITLKEWSEIHRLNGSTDSTSYYGNAKPAKKYISDDLFKKIHNFNKSRISTRNFNNNSASTNTITGMNYGDESVGLVREFWEKVGKNENKIGAVKSSNQKKISAWDNEDFLPGMNLSCEDFKDIKRCFIKANVSGDGYLNIEELKNFMELRRTPITHLDAKNFLRFADPKFHSRINFKELMEFVNAFGVATERPVQISEEDFAQLVQIQHEHQQKQIEVEVEVEKNVGQEGNNSKFEQNTCESIDLEKAINFFEEKAEECRNNERYTNLYKEKVQLPKYTAFPEIHGCTNTYTSTTGNGNGNNKIWNNILAAELPSQVEVDGNDDSVPGVLVYDEIRSQWEKISRAKKIANGTCTITNNCSAILMKGLLNQSNNMESRSSVQLVLPVVPIQDQIDCDYDDVSVGLKKVGPFQLSLEDEDKIIFRENSTTDLQPDFAVLSRSTNKDNGLDYNKSTSSWENIAG